MTGTSEFFRTKSINPFPPRGMITSTVPAAFISSAAASRPAGSSVTVFSSSSCFRSTFLISSTIARFELKASLPPFSTQVLPDLKQSENTSKLTLGRASYMIPTTPNGTDTFVIFIPFGLSVSIRVLPRGEGRAATLRISLAILFILSGVSSSRSYSGFEVCSAARSSALAARISPVAATASSASASNTVLIFSSVMRLSNREAFRVSCCQKFSIIIIIW